MSISTVIVKTYLVDRHVYQGTDTNVIGKFLNAQFIYCFFFVKIKIPDLVV